MPAADVSREFLAFLDRMLAEPKNDSIRLIFADWCGEKGLPCEKYLRDIRRYHLVAFNRFAGEPVRPTDIGTLLIGVYRRLVREMFSSWEEAKFQSRVKGEPCRGFGSALPPLNGFSDWFYRLGEYNKDRTNIRCRTNGKVKLWKSRPEDFRLPVKRGLHFCFYLTPENAPHWVVENPQGIHSACKVIASDGEVMQWGRERTFGTRTESPLLFPLPASQRPPGYGTIVEWMSDRDSVI